MIRLLLVLFFCEIEMRFAKVFRFVLILSVLFGVIHVKANAQILPDGASLELLVVGDFGLLGAAVPDGAGGILFSDIDNETIHHFDILSGEVTAVAPDSGGANGLLFDVENGHLYAAEGSSRRRIIKKDGDTVTVLAEEFEGQPFSGPNDLVRDSQGGIYFTDNGFFQDIASFESVYYLSPEGDLSRLITDLGRPNGIALSPDETKLYVSAPTVDPFSGNGRLWQYDLTAPGVVENKNDIAIGLFDGITVDPLGNIFASDFPSGVKAWDEAGNLLLDVAFPNPGPPLGAGTTNVNFADESVAYPNTLYVTTWYGQIYSLELAAVPEPNASYLAMFGLAVFSFRRRRR